MKLGLVSIPPQFVRPLIFLAIVTVGIVGGTIRLLAARDLDGADWIALAATLLVIFAIVLGAFGLMAWQNRDKTSSG